MWLLTCPNDRKSLMSCINSLRLRAYSVDERSIGSQLSSGGGGDWLSVGTEIDEILVGRFVFPRVLRLKLKFIASERGKRGR